MTVINLTEEYVKSDPPFLEKMMAKLDLDEYWASSFHAAKEHFRQYPPRKMDISYFERAAYVHMNDLDVKANNGIDYEHDDPISFWLYLEKLCKDKTFFFELRDSTMSIAAAWESRDISECSMYMSLFGLNEKTFVTVPETLLKYTHTDEGDWFTVKSLKLESKPRKKYLKKKLIEIVHDVFEPLPQQI